MFKFQMIKCLNAQVLECEANNNEASLQARKWLHTNFNFFPHRETIKFLDVVLFC